MALDLGEMVGHLGLDTSDFDKGVASSEQGGPRISKSMVVAGAAIGAAAFGIGKALYGVGATFDEMEDTIRAGTGASGEALDGLMGVARDVGRNVPASFEDIGPVIADLNTRLGLSGETLETVASQYLEAGRILGEDVDINQTAAAFKAFGIEGENVEHAMDSLFRASQATGVGMNELAAGVQKAAPAMQTLGFSFEDSIALMGSLDKAGLNSGQMAGALTRSLGSLAKTGEEPKAAFERIVGEMQGFIESGDKAAALNLAGEIFGTRGASQFVKAIEDGVLELDNLMAAAGASGDTILGVGKETMDASEQFQILKNRALLALEPIAAKIFRALSEGMKWVTEKGVPGFQRFADIVKSTVGPAVDAVTGFLERNHKWLTVVGILIASVFIPHLIALGVAATVSAAKSAAAWIVSQAGAVAAAAIHSATVLRMVAGWVLMGAQSLIQAGRMAAAWFIALGPIGWAIAAIIGVVALVIANWDKVKKVTQKVWTAVVSWIKKVPGWIVGFFAKWTLVGVIVRHWDTMKSRTISIATSTVNWLRGLPGRVITAVSALGRLLLSWAQSAFGRMREGAVSRVTALLGYVREIPGRIKSAIGNLGNLLWNAGQSVVSGLWNGIASMGSWLASKISGFVRDRIPGPVRSALGINSPSRVMAEVGRWIPIGLADGIDAGGGYVDASVARMSGRVTALSARTAPLSARDTYASSRPGQTFNIYETVDARTTAAETARRLAWAG